MGGDYLKAFLFLNCASCWHLCEYNVWPFFKILLNTVFWRRICLLVVCLLTSINCLCAQPVSCSMKNGFSPEKIIYKMVICFWRGESSLFRNVHFFLIHLRWNLAALQSCCSVSQWVSISFIKSPLSFHHSGREVGIYQEIQCRPSIFYISVSLHC